MSEIEPGNLSPEVLDVLNAFQYIAFRTQLIAAYMQSIDYAVYEPEYRPHPSVTEAYEVAKWQGLLAVREEILPDSKINGEANILLRLCKINPRDGSVMPLSWRTMAQRFPGFGESLSLWPFNKLHFDTALKQLGEQRYIGWEPASSRQQP